MRKKAAGRLFALIMALITLSLSLPPAALAEYYYSNEYGVHVEPAAAESATPAEVIAAAIAANQATPKWLDVYNAWKTNTNAEKTGETYTYSIGLNFGPPEKYNDQDVSTPAYNTYENVRVTVEAPDGVVLLVDGVEKTSHTYTIGNVPASAGGSNQTITVSARMTGNGEAADGTVFGKLKITAEADVTPDGGGDKQTFKYLLDNTSGQEKNKTTAKNAASTDWQIRKSLSGTPSVTEDEVTITWKIRIGRTEDAQLVGLASYYNVPGTLNFSAFSLTDTLPEINGYAPKSAKLVGGGAEKTTGAGETTIATDAYNTIPLTGDAANAGGISTPSYTEYTLTAVYDKAAFVLPFGGENIEYTNSAQLKYTAVGESEDTRTDSATDDFGIPTAGGQIKVFEMLKIGDKAPVEYSAFYQTLFPNGATFEVYGADGWDTTANAPAAGAQPVSTLTVTGTTGATTPLMAPGTYYVRQTGRPQGTEASSPEWKEVVVTSGQTAETTFVNPVTLNGILSIEKKDDQGVSLSNIAFEITKVGDPSFTAKTITTGTDGKKSIVLGPGNYLLTEKLTTGQQGLYYPAAPQQITIVGGEETLLTGNNAIVNRRKYDNCTLTINKLVTDGVTGTSAVPVTQKDSNAVFTFKIYRSTDSSFTPGEGTYVQDATIQANKASVAVPNLPAMDENGNPYYYKVVEMDGGLARYTYDTAEKAFSFTENGATVTSRAVSATNILKSALKIKKIGASLASANAPMSGITFDVYDNAALTGTPVATITTGSDGTGTTNVPLPVADASGVKINYYLVETNAPDGYTPGYSGGNGYFGPVTLGFGLTTDRSGTPYTNTKQEVKLTIEKKKTGGGNVAGAKFWLKNSAGKYVAIQSGAIQLGDTGYDFVTDANGRITIPGLPIDTYTVIEQWPGMDTLERTGSVTISGVTGAPGTMTEGDVVKLTHTAAFTAALQSATVTFKNDEKGKLSLHKTVDGADTALDGFGFKIWRDTAEGLVAESDSIGSGSITGSNSYTKYVTPDTDYYFEEVSWPASVLSPSLVYTETNAANKVLLKDGKVLFGPYRVPLNGSQAVVVDNVSNTGNLTITKRDSKTEGALAGATFKISVPASGLSDGVKALLESKGFALDAASGSYTFTTAATDANGTVTLVNLPVYDGTAKISYAISEETAPATHLKDEKTENTTLKLHDLTGVAFDNAPKATITVTKNYYKQWEKDSGNQRLYPLSDTDLAVFELGEDGKLALVGTSQATGADGKTTFEGLDGTKTYYVFELGNAKGYTPEDGRSVAGSVGAINGKTLGEVSGFYYNEVALGGVTNNQGVTTMVNVEQYVQVTLEKYYIPETEVEGEWQDTGERTPLNRAKFYLYSCTEAQKSAVEGLLSSLSGSSVADVLSALSSYRVSDYVYESGTGSVDGRVVTGPLPGTNEDGERLYYWLVEFEAPAGFKAPVAPCWSNLVTSGGASGGSLENHPAHGSGGGAIRYLRIMVDKIAMVKNANGSWDTDSLVNLADTTFKLQLKTGSGWVDVTYFTTGVDVPEGAYKPGRGVSESIKMHELAAQYPDDVIFENNEYTAIFKLIESSWPGNTTPVQQEYVFTLTTNGAYDGDSSDATLWTQYTNDRNNPIKNELAKKVTVYFDKIGYAAGASNVTWPLAGAGITIYSDSKRTKPVGVEQFTNSEGRTYFTLEPNTTYYWKETTAPNGYEKVGSTEGSFTSPAYSSTSQGEAQNSAVATIRNLRSRVVTITKNASDSSVTSVTLRITKNGGGSFYADTDVNDDAPGSYVSAADLTVNLSGGTGTVQLGLLSGSYILEEIKINGRDATSAEKVNFSLANNDGADGKVSFSVSASDTAKAVTLKNPGKGGLTVLKKDDAGTAMQGIRFDLFYKAFSSLSEGEPAPGAVTGNVASVTGVTVTEAALTTDADGKITLTGLVPGWYKLVEKTGPENENYVLAEPKVFKVGDGSFAGTVTPSEEAKRTFINDRYGHLTITKAFENMSEAAGAVRFSITKRGESAPTQTVDLSAGNSWSETVALVPGIYTIKEVTTGDWYARYTVTGSAVGTENKSAWLNAAQSDGVTVTVASGNTENAAVTAAFTNVGNPASLTARKVSDILENDVNKPLAGAKFVLYYGEGAAARYYNAASKTWAAGETGATRFVSGPNGAISIAGIKLPYEMFVKEGATIATSGETFYLQEVEAPDGYTKDATPKPVTLVAGGAADIEEAFVNATAMTITLTKYGKPFAPGVILDTLDGAEFTLYKKAADGAIAQVGKATTANGGVITFTNLPKLTEEGEAYLIKETQTPAGYVPGLTQVMTADGATTFTADEDGYFTIGKDENVALNAYNTPYGRIVILKSDYINTTELPMNALFTVVNDSDAGINYNPSGTRKATAGDPALDGYALSGDHYEKDGVFYTVTMTGQEVIPGTYTVTETANPTGYLYTPNAGAGDAWSQTKSVTVPTDGSTVVVEFTNLPDPTGLTVSMEKSGEYQSAGNLQSAEYKNVSFTLSDFGTLPLPAEKAVITDEDVQFRVKGAADAATKAEWHIAKLVIGKASYSATEFGEASSAAIHATVEYKTAGGWVSGPSRQISNGSWEINLGAQAALGFRITYTGQGGAPLDHGFTAGDVTGAIEARKPMDDPEVKVVDSVYNYAEYEVTYDFGEFGAEAGVETQTATATADADVSVAAAATLPKVSVSKDSQVMNAGTPVLGDTVTPGQQLEYTITLTGIENGLDTDGTTQIGMQDPILSDVIPDGLVIKGASAATTAAGITLPGTVTPIGQNVRLEATGKLMAGETITLTILCDVTAGAMANNNTTIRNSAYAYSDHKVPLNADNPNGYSFTDEGGQWPASDIPDVPDNKALKAEEANPIASPSGLSISKLVTVGGKTIGSNGFLISELDGTIGYTVTVTNNSEIETQNVWIVDTLPYVGAGSESGWAPKLSGAASIGGAEGTVYYSTSSESEGGVIAQHGSTAPGGWTTSAGGAKSILAIIPTLGANQSVTLSYTCVAPTLEEANASNTTYYYFAVNDAIFAFDNGPESGTRSADTKVTILPNDVRLGDRVWIDENANGIQDSGEDRVPGSAVAFALTTYVDDAPMQTQHTTADAGGIYGFSATPARPSGETASYDANGDVRFSSLLGYARYTHRLSLDLPNGYVLTRKYVGGSVPTVDAGGSTRGTDSNFDPSSRQSERFYLKVGQDDLTYDAGLIYTRDLTLTKKGTNGLMIEGAKYAVYGPYYETPDAIGDNKVATITTGPDGKGTPVLEGGVSYLNAYAYYVIVETEVPENYTIDGLAVDGVRAVLPASGISGVPEGAEAFILTPYTGDPGTGALNDSVTVTNPYAATGKLNIGGTKELDGDVLAEGQFTFELYEGTDTSGDPIQTTKNGADGTYAFDTLTFDYEDLLGQPDGGYIYSVKEVNEGADGIIYDETVYTLTVTLADGGNGYIIVNATAAGGDGAVVTPGSRAGESAAEVITTASLPYRNRAEGMLTVQKTVEGNVDADKEKDFRFTLILADAHGEALAEQSFTAEHSGDDAISDITTDANGKYTFTLRHGQTFKVLGLLAGTRYAVEEELYSQDGFITTRPENAEGSIATGLGADVIFVNTRNVGSLRVTKSELGTGKSAEPKRQFRFTVVLEHATLPVNNPYGNLVFTQAEAAEGYKASAEFLLEDAQTIEITGLPEGTRYTVVEDDYTKAGYITRVGTLTTDTAAGDISAEETDEVFFTNTRDIGKLKITKAVVANGSESPNALDRFSVTVVLTAPANVDLVGSYTLGDTAEEISVAATEGGATWSNTFELEADGFVQFAGLPAGTRYGISEADYSGYGYAASYSNETGTVAASPAEADGNTETVTNTINTGNLTVAKTVTGTGGETDRAFNFNLVLVNDEVPVEGVYTAEGAGLTTLTVDAQGKASFTLTHGQSVTLYGIPAGTAYSVTEESVDADGYATDRDNESGTILANETASAGFTNHRDVGGLVLEKRFAGNAPVAGDRFTFTIRLSRADGVDINRTYDAQLNGAPATIAFEGGVASVSLTGGDNYEIFGILSGTEFDITEEIPAGSGYAGASQGETGSIPVGESAAATFTNTRNAGSLSIRKTVAGNTGETDRDFNFTIHLTNPDGTAASGTYPMTGGAASEITFTNGYAGIALSSGEQATITGILAGSAYEVSEIEANTEGYATTSTQTSGGIVAGGDSLATFVNTRNATGTTSRTVVKFWDDEGNADALRPSSLRVYLFADGVAVDSATLRAATGWTATFTNLPIYNTDGSTVRYRVREVAVPEYAAAYQYLANTVNITNSHTPDDFDRTTTRLTLIEEYGVPLGGNINMNEGDCFN
jgi:archaellum component FlaF (FlaF/FlaG flagellin family)